MASWTGVITNAGNMVLNEWVNEKVLTFDRAAGGQGTVSIAGLLAQTSLVSQQQEANLLGGEQDNNGIRIKIRLPAADTAYTLNQIGVWASVTGGDETMIALFQHEQGIPIPGKYESPDFLYTFYGLITCSNTGEWTVNIDSSMAVTFSDMTYAINQAMITRQEMIIVNGILKSDGLGNVSAAEAGQDYAALDSSGKVKGEQLPIIWATVRFMLKDGGYVYPADMDGTIALYYDQTLQIMRVLADRTFVLSNSPTVTEMEIQLPDCGLQWSASSASGQFALAECTIYSSGPAIIAPLYIDTTTATTGDTLALQLRATGLTFDSIRICAGFIGEVSKI